MSSAPHLQDCCEEDGDVTEGEPDMVASAHPQTSSAMQEGDDGTSSKALQQVCVYACVCVLT